MQDEIFILVDKAVEGDKKALESLIISVQDMIYNLSLRMLGTLFEAEDATQEIIIKVMTQLSTFRKESAFSTWVYRIAINSLINYKKSFFAKRPLSFDFYAEDIDRGFVQYSSEIMQNIDENLLAEELKQSCTNVMLQCLEPENRVIYVLGVMFKLESKICGEILGITPEAYRQKLSRIRKKVGLFLGEYCGLSGTGKCSCQKRIGYAIQTNRLNPNHLEFSNLVKLDQESVTQYTQSMEEIDRISLIFESFSSYQSPEGVRSFIETVLNSENMNIIKGGHAEMGRYQNQEIDSK